MNQFHTFGLKPFMLAGDGEYVSHDGFSLKFKNWNEEISYFSPAGKLILSDTFDFHEFLKHIKAELCTETAIYQDALVEWKSANEGFPIMRYNRVRENWDCDDGRYVDADPSQEFKFVQALFSPKGEILEKDFIHYTPGFRWLKPDTSEGNPINKIGSGHLTKGTTFKTKGLGLGRSDDLLNKDGYTHTVNALYLNAAGHYLIETTDLVKDICDKTKMVNKTFSIRFVSEIIQRGSEEVVALNCRAERGLLPVHELDTIRDILIKRVIGALSDKETQCRYFNYDKLKNRLMQMGLIRKTSRWTWILTDEKKARKFIKKNPHWALHTMSHSTKQERWECEKMYADQDWDF